MSDISESLLDAYMTDLAALSQTGETLSWIRAYGIPGETNLLEWAGLLPLVLVMPEEDILTPNCLEGSHITDRVVYRFKMSCITKAYNQSYGTHSPNVPDYRKAVQYKRALKSRYNRRTFDISSLCVLTNVRYGASSIPGLTINNQVWGWGVDLILEHDWIDRTLVT
jgi:hypothetical protein